MQNADKIKCEVCGNKDINRFISYIKKENYKLLKCEECSFVFIPLFYRKSIPYENYRDEEVLSEVRKGNNWLKYKRHSLRISLLKKQKKKGKLLDVGCGWGHFLYTAKKKGFDSLGIELSELMHSYATNDLNLNVLRQDFFKADVQENSFDIITMWDVLEHIENPKEALEKVNSLLKDDGIFVFQVPQIDSIVAKKQKENWSMISIEHINYFSKATVETFLRNNGFEPIKIKSSFEFKLFIMFTVLPLLKRRKNKNISKDQISNSERQSFFNKFTKFPHFILVIIMFFHDILYKAMTNIKVGEEMIVIAKKKKV